MIGYVTLGTNDLAESTMFYDGLLNIIGAQRAFTTDKMAVWKFGEKSTMLSVTTPFDKGHASVGNGVMVALSVDGPSAVDTLHAKALELGATNEGDPGFRGKSFYAGYFRDLDGNKLNFYCYP